MSRLGVLVVASGAVLGLLASGLLATGSRADMAGDRKGLSLMVQSAQAAASQAPGASALVLTQSSVQPPPATRPPFRPGAAPSAPFSYAEVLGKARALAAAAFEPPAGKAPAAAGDLNYDQYRRIEFKRDAADWADGEGAGFHLHYESQGFLFKDPIAVNLVTDGEARPRPLVPGEFNFFDLPLSDDDKNALRFAGWHATAPLNSAGKFDDIINFKGASFFRALGAGNAYGASARGLALATASPNGEEFPAFREFWIERPAFGANRLSVYALMDSPSAAGAFHFIVEPGAQTIVDVEATFFPRKDVTEAGVAPLTSMFDFAPQDPAPGRQDFRPRVHDSDGFMFRLRNGEWVWRPLSNPNRLEISTFAERTPLGFGLIQRERRFSAYEDLEAQYEKRPSVWIAPQGDWGRGKLMLVEIPTSNEFNDNIVAFWRPEAPWKKGEEVKLAYTMYWGLETPMQPTVARVEATKTGAASNGGRLFIIDFQSENASLFDGAIPTVTTSAGAIANVTLTRNVHSGGVRLSFELQNQSGAPAELRAVLNRAERAVSETWLYRWSGA